MKYQAYFSDSLDSLVNEEFICEADAMVDVMPVVSRVVKEHPQHEPYWRWMFPAIGAAIDFGSWSRYIIITNAKMEDCF